MTCYETILRRHAPEMNATHMESLAIGLHSTLNSLPDEAFREIAELARRMGADRLAAFHRGMCA
jgi:hypothetical protein